MKYEMKFLIEIIHHFYKKLKILLNINCLTSKQNSDLKMTNTKTFRKIWLPFCHFYFLPAEF